MPRPKEIILEAKERFKVAHFGLEMLQAGQGEARIGLRNIAVFGRMATFATNNLRSIVDGFQAWDVGAKARHFNNENCKYMNDLRNVIEKQARTPLASVAHVKSFQPADLNKFPRPPGAFGFFIGDMNGGSGWLVAGPDGEEGRFYVSLPEEIGRVWCILPEFGNKDAVSVATEYINSLENYLYEVEVYVTGREP